MLRRFPLYLSRKWEYFGERVGLRLPSSSVLGIRTEIDSRAPSATAVGTFATQGSAGLFMPTPGHLSISEYGADSGQREKSGNEGEWRLRKRSGDTDTREQGTEKSGRRGPGGYQLSCFAGSRSGWWDGNRRWNRAAGRRGQVLDCPG